MCEICKKIENQEPLWQDRDVFVTQDFEVILKRHDDDCTGDEWDHVLEIIKKLFNFSKIAYEGHDCDHFHVTIHKFTSNDDENFYKYQKP